MTQRNLTIRLSVRDGDVVRRALNQLGEEGSRSLARIEQAARPASRGLLALNEVTAAARGRLEDYAGNLGGVGSALLRLGPAGLVAGAALGGLGMALGQGLRELEEAERSLLRLEGVLKATGHASGLTGRQLGELAESMEAGTLATAEGVLDAASVLATFRSVAGDTFLRTIRAAQDLSAVFGQDLRSSALQLGKALEDPVAGVTALRQVGVTFTAGQREMIAALVETGDVAGAQGVILETLERQVGGAGAAEAGGLTGAVHHLKAAWGNLLEEMARTPAVGGVVQTTITGLTRLVEGARELFQAPDVSRQVAEKSRRLASVEDRISAYEAAGAGRRRLDELRRQAGMLRREIEALVERGSEEVAAFAAEQDQAESGQRLAEEERNAEAVATRIKALEAEKAKAAADGAERVAAINAQLARDIAAADARRGRPGIAEADIDREIALLQDIAARKVAAVEKPLRTAAARASAQAQGIVADLERQLGALSADPRQAAIDQALARLPEGAGAERRREVERLSGALFDQRQALDQLKEAHEAEAQLREKGAAITRRQRNAEEEYQDTLAELDLLLANAALSHETYAQAVEEAERRKLAASREWSDGAARALADYAAAAGDAARAAEEATTRAFRSMEDALVSFATTGKLEVESLVDSVVADITRMAVRKGITGPLVELAGEHADDLFGSIGTALAGLFHTGGVVGASAVPTRAVDPLMFVGAPRLHQGGVAGLLPDEVPAILKRGETVLTPRQMAGLTERRRDTRPPVTVVMNISTPDGAGFRQAQGQIAAEAARALERARRNL